MLSRPVVDEAAQEPVHALPGAADHGRQVRLCEGPIELDLARGPRVPLSRQAAPVASTGVPARSRKWSSSTWPVRRRSSRASAVQQRRTQPRDPRRAAAGTSSRGRASVSVARWRWPSSSAATPSSRASSPKKSPGLRLAMIASSPSVRGQDDLHRLRSATTWSESPMSPWWKITSLRRNRRRRMRPARSSGVVVDVREERAREGCRSPGTDRSRVRFPPGRCGMGDHGRINCRPTTIDPSRGSRCRPADTARAIRPTRSASGG